jgi:hypothetical protein
MSLVSLSISRLLAAVLLRAPLPSVSFPVCGTSVLSIRLAS